MVTSTNSPAKARGKRLPIGPHNTVQLLLIQSVDHLGKQGDVVNVKRGYAMNFLLPQGLATVATDHHKRMIEKHKSRLQDIQNNRLAGLRNLGEQIRKLSVNIEANADEKGHLYGSVSANDIVNALKRHEITITTDQVRLKGTIKELGLYTIDIHLGQDIESELKVWVLPTIAEDQPQAAQPGAAQTTPAKS